jgi:23S rRNA (adenine2030-N6)-methyltransferase
MNYRHLYHAGNFADVFKHTILLAVLTALQRKAAAYCYLDTHAGAGLYQLTSAAAQKTQEYKRGIHALLARNSAISLPTVLQRYLALVEHYHVPTDPELMYYPGSPLLARQVLRVQDRMLLCELQPDELLQLKQQFVRDKQVATHHCNGYQALKALLPPREQRGLVLIDPPFEAADEFSQIIQGLSVALKRWHHGIYAIWYPIKHRWQVKEFQQHIISLSVPHINAELTLLEPAPLPPQLTACGMVIINPPWQLYEELQHELFPCLAQLLHARTAMTQQQS